MSTDDDKSKETIEIIRSIDDSTLPTISLDRPKVSMDAESTAYSDLPSGATTPAPPELSYPPKVQEALQLKASGATPDAVIIGIAVVDFNHLVGPQVEYAHPKELLEDEELCGSLPFLALPDGSHQVSRIKKVSEEIMAHQMCSSPTKTSATFISPARRFTMPQSLVSLAIDR